MTNQLRTRRLALEPMCRGCAQPATEVDGLDQDEVELTSSWCARCYSEHGGSPTPEPKRKPSGTVIGEICPKCGSHERYKSGGCKPCGQARARGAYRRKVATKGAERAAAGGPGADTAGR